MEKLELDILLPTPQPWFRSESKSLDYFFEKTVKHTKIVVEVEKNISHKKIRDQSKKHASLKAQK